MKRLIHWIFKSRKKQRRHCCMTCRYWDMCVENEGE
nr:MAG TPA: hypothetical protein [Caudoviricetes sp.]